MTRERFEQICDRATLFLLNALMIGTPLVFTSLTRSVFEVNKLLLLRVITILVVGLWLFRYRTLKDNGLDNDPLESYNLLGFRWKKIGLEIPVALWVILNVLSTIFAKNLYVAIIGAYDRWEGIITILNYVILIYMYAKLMVKRRMLYWLIGGMLTSTGISAVYGVLQSLGWDFMNWSVDPTARVFACINNPVHFCAYVGMVVPVGVGTLLFLVDRSKPDTELTPKALAFRWFIFLLTCLIYYTQFLSFSRATWMGFIGAMSLFYLLVTNNFDSTSRRRYVLDFLVTSAALAMIYLKFIFHYDTMSMPLAGMAVSFKFLLYPLYIFFAVYTAWAVGLFESAVLQGGRAFYLPRLKKWLARFLIIAIFTQLQFVAISLVNIAGYFLVGLAYYWAAFYKNESLSSEKKSWLMIFIYVFAIVMITPTLPGHMARLFHLGGAKNELRAVQNVEGKVGSYSEVAIKGTARTSMWKSAVPWIRENWWLGTGPDTIKYMYPLYRRSEYGRLEGGHNYTPDRLHNEYLNTFATRGIPASLVYYVGMMLGWVVLMVRGIYRMKDNPHRNLAIAFLAGGTVYLGQVMFNFGVVATLVIFYMLIGMGLAIIHHPDFQTQEGALE